MKKVRFVIHQPLINKVVGSELIFELDDGASLVDAINHVDKLISSKGGFPMPDYVSLLHMVYNPVEDRFYNQVAVTAHLASGEILNVRANPKQPLSAESTVILIPTGGCISEWEEAVKPADFWKALSYESEL